MKALNEAAAHKAAVSALKKPDVPVGTHDMSRVRVIIDFPEGAEVNRAAGDLGDGYETPSDKAVSNSAVLLLLQKLDIKVSVGMWKECIVDVVQRKLKAKDLMPKEAIEAMKLVIEDMPEDCQPKDATSAVCTGMNGVEICVQRMPLRSTRGRRPAMVRRA